MCSIFSARGGQACVLRLSRCYESSVITCFKAPTQLRHPGQTLTGQQRITVYDLCDQYVSGNGRGTSSFTKFLYDETKLLYDLI